MRISIITLLIVGSTMLFGQEGPAGINSNLELWLNTSNLSLNNDDPVATWSDLSGNANNATQSTNSFRPLFKTNQLNGHAAVQFDGIQTRLDIAPSIDGGDITLFMVNSVSSSAVQTIMHLNKNIIYTHLNNQGLGSSNPWSPLVRPIVQGNFHIFSALEEDGASGASRTVSVGNNSFSNTRNDLYSFGSTQIGCALSNGYTQFLNGSIAEIILYNTQLNTAERNIISNHLAAKYNLTPVRSLYSFGSAYGIDLKGIGQEADGSNTSARGNDNLEISNASALGNGDYILIASDGGNYNTSSSVPATIAERWNRVWKTDVTGTPGTIDLTFYLESNAFAADPNDYVVLIENVDGDFSNGGTSIQESGRIYDGINNTITFTGITLSDGSHFTLAEKSADSPVSSTGIEFGPGGVGNGLNIDTWLDASSLSLSNNDQVDNWTDLSGNSNDATQATSSFRPSFKTNQLNGLPAIEFDGSQTRLEITPTIDGGEATYFIVNSVRSSSLQTIMHSNKNLIYTQLNSQGVGSTSPWSPLTRPIVQGNFHIFSAIEEDGAAGANRSVLVGSNSVSGVRNELFNLGSTVIGCALTNTYTQFYNGLISEIIVFNERLNSAQRKIVSNYLGAKYSLTPEQNLFSFGSTHGNGVIGVGQESDGSHTSSRDLNDSLLISSPSALDNGDYIMVGHNNLGFTTTASGNNSYVEAWDRIWRVDVTGTPGTIDLEFFLGSNGFSAVLNYALIVDSDGDFSSGAAVHSTGRSYNATNNSISFTGVNFSDGDYFTLAEVSSESTAQDGDWGTAATWACNCIPGSTDNVVINHDVTINSNQSILDLTIASGGNLAIASNQTLSIHGDMIIDGTFASATGTIEAVDATGGQSFDNSSSNIIDIYNLVVNNNSGLTVQSGGWAIQNNLQVSAGGMNVSSADSVVLYSDASSTAQILSSMSNAFTGDFTIRRYISARSSRYSNQSSPISNGTVADLDDDLYLSGVGGNDADVLTSGGQTFRSVRAIAPNPYTYVPLTTTASALEQGRGYEVYLDASTGFLPATTIDYVGTPTSGSVSYPVDFGWNLIGNPYQSFIDFGAITSSGLSTTYYIYNTSTRSWNALNSSTPIAPGQGFYVNKTTAGIANVTFDENDKVSSNSSSFLRRKSLENDFTLSLTSLDNQFSHQMQLKFDPMSSNSLEQNDASYLISPEEKAPAIYAKPVGMNKKLVINALSSWDESHKIPVEIYAGVEGKYNITSENMTSIYDNYECVYLYDREEKQTIDLSVEQSYEFTSDKGTHERFDIVVSNSATHCMDMIKSDVMVQNIQDFVNLRNAYNHWFIDYQFDNEDIRQLEVNVYNMNGQQVVAPNNISVSGTGNYKIEGLNELKGIYLIQIKSNNEVFTQTISL